MFARTFVARAAQRRAPTRRKRAAQSIVPAGNVPAGSGAAGRLQRPGTHSRPLDSAGPGAGARRRLLACGRRRRRRPRLASPAGAAARRSPLGLPPLARAAARRLGRRRACDLARVGHLQLRERVAQRPSSRGHAALEDLQQRA